MVFEFGTMRDIECQIFPNKTRGYGGPSNIVDGTPFSEIKAARVTKAIRHELISCRRSNIVHAGIRLVNIIETEKHVYKLERRNDLGDLVEVTPFVDLKSKKIVKQPILCATDVWNLGLCVHEILLARDEIP